MVQRRNTADGQLQSGVVGRWIGWDWELIAVQQRPAADAGADVGRATPQHRRHLHTARDCQHAVATLGQRADRQDLTLMQLQGAELRRRRSVDGNVRPCRDSDADRSADDAQRIAVQRPFEDRRVGRIADQRVAQRGEERIGKARG